VTITVKKPGGDRWGIDARNGVGPVTVDKHFKRLVRARAARSGESYTAALWHFRRQAEALTMSPTPRATLADLGFSITIPDGWRRTTHSIWSASRPAMHCQASSGDGWHAEYELVCARQGHLRVSPQAAAEEVRRELSKAYAKFEYADTALDGRPATRLDCTEPFGAPEYIRQYCVEHNDHLLRLRFVTTNRAASESSIDAAVASIGLAEPATECTFGELALVDYAPASLECVLVGSLIAHQLGEELSGRHLVASLVHGDSGIAASILQSLGVTPERLRDAPPSDDDDPDLEVHRLPVPAAAFSLLTSVVPRYARDTVRSHHVLLGILSPRNNAGGIDRLHDLDIDAAKVRIALADRIAFENDTNCNFCSFCRRPALDVAQMTQGPFSQICDECIAACTALLGGRPPPPDSIMQRYTGTKQDQIYTACGYCGNEEGLLTAPPKTHFICDGCAVRIADNGTNARPTANTGQ